jgi:RNA polymerase sigma factor (sigma-70 family)
MKEKPYIIKIREERANLREQMVLAYQEHQDKLLYKLYEWGLRIREDAEDLVQQVWTEILIAFRRGRTNEWSDKIIYVVAWHSFLDHVRQRRNRARLLQERKAELPGLIELRKPANLDGKDGDSDIAAPCFDLDTQVLIGTLVIALPISERKVVLMHYFEGRTIPETARQLNTSASTVKRMQASAVASMRSRVA